MKRLSIVLIVLLFSILILVPYTTAADQDDVPLLTNKPLKSAHEGDFNDTEITWDFETGDLRGWKAEGEAFRTQPTLDDNPTARHRDQPSGHQEQYWIGSYENRHLPSDPPGRTQGDFPKGDLTSANFLITKPVISFLIGGGCDRKTERVELLVKGETTFQETGKCTETMERKCWDVSSLIGKDASIRLIDDSSDGWGHINFDDVHFVGAPGQEIKSIMDAEGCMPTAVVTSPVQTIEKGQTTESGTRRTTTIRRIRIR